MEDSVGPLASGRNDIEAGRTPLSEHFEHEPLDQRSIDWFMERSIPRDAMIRPWSILRAKVTIDRTGRFTRDPAGTDVFTLTVEEGEAVVDLVAWDPRTNRLATFCGQAFALGQEQILSAGTYALGGALRVHRSPLSWLRAGRRGIVIVRVEDAYLRLGQIDRIEAEDSIHARELHRLIEPPPPRVQITFPGDVVA